VLAAAAVRVVVVPRQSLWADELFSLAIATGHSLEQPASEADPALGDYVESPRAEPAWHYARYLAHDHPPAGLRRVVRATALSDTSPPLYYALLWAWTRVLGTSDVALRLLSVLASLIALVLLAELARRLAGRLAGLAAAALFALSPVGVLYSTEGRMYALQFLWSAATLLVAQRLHARGGRPLLVVLYGVIGGLGLLTHYFFAPFLAAVSLALLLQPGRSRRGRLLVAVVLAVAIALPWYATLAAAAARWRVTGGWLRLPPSNFDPLWTRLALPWSLFSVDAAEGVPGWVDFVNGAALLGLLLWALAARGRRLVRGPRLAVWLAAAAAAFTPLLADAVLGTYASAHPRYALAGLPPAIVVVALLASLLSRRRLAFVMALLLTIGLAGSFRVQRAASRVSEPFDRVGAWLARDTSAGDVAIVHSIPSVVCGVARYALAAGAGPASAPIASWVAPLGRREVPRDLVTLASGRRRVVLVEMHTVAGDVAEERWLRASARLAREETFEKARLVVFEPWRGGRFGEAAAGVASVGGRGR
jgi:hypothetical protein